jgi:hypothetical protein
MCRNIKTLFNFDPPATDEEIRAASLQFVRKLSGSHTRRKPMRPRSSKPRRSVRRRPSAHRFARDQRAAEES